MTTFWFKLHFWQQEKKMFLLVPCGTNRSSDFSSFQFYSQNSEDMSFFTLCKRPYLEHTVHTIHGPHHRHCVIPKTNESALLGRSPPHNKQAYIWPDMVTTGYSPHNRASKSYTAIGLSPSRDRANTCRATPKIHQNIHLQWIQKLQYMSNVAFGTW